jgi:group I intron endonuclease
MKIYYLHKGDDVPFYIGYTSDIINRKSSHRTTYGLDTYLEVLDDVDDYKSEETFYINMFKSWGFNLLNQNEGGGGLTKHSDETKQKISDTWQGKSKTELEEINIKRSLGNQIPKPGAGYRGWTQEHLNRLNKISPFNQPDWSDKCKKPVNMIDKTTNKIVREFGSVTEASYIMGIKQSTLSHCLTGRTKTSAGYKWQYKNNVI